MKKILSFVLVLAMVLGSVSMAFAKTATFSDVKGLACEEAVNVLAGLGVIDGYPDGEFKPARNITRAEAVKLIVGALAIPVYENSSYETPFKDVPADSWYAGYVAYANRLGITKGTSETEFSPNAMVTSDQMIAFTMRALGYTESVLQGEYPACFINKAVGLRVLDGVSTGSQAAPRGEIAQLIYNCLTKQIGTVGADGMWHGAMIADDVTYTGEKVDTMLNRLGAIEREDYELVTEDVIEEALVDLTPYHGAVVKLYENEDGDAIALAEVKTTFVTGKFKDGKLDGYKIVGDDEEDYEAGGELVGEAITITNGAEDDADSFNLTKEGTYAVTFKGGKINEVYSFQSWTIDKIIQVSSDDVKDMAEDEPTVAGYSFPLDDDDELDTSKFILAGADALKDIEKDDVLYIYENPETGVISKIEVGTESVKGEFTKIRGRSADSDQDRYVVGGTTYEGADETKGADYTSTLKDANIGNEYTVYLGYDGKLCYADGEDDTTTDYVVFLKFWEPGRGDADNRKNNGKSGLSVFAADGREELYFKKGYMSDAEELKVEVGQLVKITKNSKGDVTNIEAVNNPDPTESDVTKKGRVVEYEAALNASSVIYNYKGDETLDELEDDANYSVVKASSLYDKDDVAFEALHKTSKGYVAAALITGATGKVDDIVILTAKLYTIKDAEEATVFMDGEKKTITAELDVFAPYAKPTTEEKLMAVIYRLTETDSDGVITEADKDFVADDIVLATDAGLRVENDVIFDAGDAPYEIEDGAVFYLFDISENKWSVVSKNALSGLKAGEKNNQGICVKAIKTDDAHDGYDIFVVLRN